MIAEFRSKNSVDEYKKVNARLMKISTIIVMSISTILIMLGISLLILVGVGVATNDDIVAGIMYILFGSFLLGFFIVALKKGQAKQIESNKTYFDGEIYIRVDEDKLFYENTSKFSKTTMETFYEGIYKIVENKDMFIFYLSISSLITISKDSIFTGSLEEVIEIFENKMGNKFKAYKK